MYIEGLYHSGQPKSLNLHKLSWFTDQIKLIHRPFSILQRPILVLNGQPDTLYDRLISVGVGLSKHLMIKRLNEIKIFNFKELKEVKANWDQMKILYPRLSRSAPQSYIITVCIFTTVFITVNINRLGGSLEMGWSDLGGFFPVLNEVTPANCRFTFFTPRIDRLSRKCEEN